MPSSVPLHRVSGYDQLTADAKPPTLPNPVRFGAFEIDRDAGQLTRSGRRVHLAPQALRLLLLLIDKQGALVAREEIRAALWSDDTFVDVDSAVNACISQIRTVLGDKPTAPRFVETIPRRGYRFVAPLNAVQPADTRNRIGAGPAAG